MVIIVNKKLCLKDHECPAVKICPMEALSQSNFKAPKVDPEKCTECGKCIDFCENGAFQFES
jgi:Fe-S-cluster-containing hydrogenase component 2